MYFILKNCFSNSNKYQTAPIEKGSTCEKVVTCLQFLEKKQREQVRSCQCYVYNTNIKYALTVLENLKRGVLPENEEKKAGAAIDILQAYTSSEIKIVTSYKTDVAIIIDSTMYILGRYSTTTTQQLSKVRYDYNIKNTVYLLLDDWYEKPANQLCLESAYKNGNCRIFALPTHTKNEYRYYDLAKPDYFPKRKNEREKVETAAKQI